MTMRAKLRANGLMLSMVSGILTLSSGVSADKMPEFFDQTLPAHAAAGIVSAYAALQGDGAALDGRTRELVSLAVAAQIPCEYCVHVHASKAREFGASEAEVRETIAAAGFVRLFSTVFHGNDYDYDRFIEEFDQSLAGN